MITQEDKELLLRDLCMRLPYGVKVQHQHQDYLNEVQTIENISKKYGEIETESVLGFVDDFKPYLFPLSNMTNEQKKEFLSVAGYETREEDCGRHTETYYYDMVGHENTLCPNCDAIDWLNAHHFDHRGLIEKELALDATGLNIY